MNFCEGLEYVQNGYKIKRKDWRHGFHLSLKFGLHSLDEKDMEANDWEVLDLENPVENFATIINEHERTLNIMSKQMSELFTAIKDLKQLYLEINGQMYKNHMVLLKKFHLADAKREKYFHAIHAIKDGFEISNQENLGKDKETKVRGKKKLEKLAH